MHTNYWINRGKTRQFKKDCTISLFAYDFRKKVIYDWSSFNWSPEGIEANPNVSSSSGEKIVWSVPDNGTYPINGICIVHKVEGEVMRQTFNGFIGPNSNIEADFSGVYFSF